MIKLTDLTSKFRHVRLVLARGKGHPEGDSHEGYDLLVPLDGYGQLDAVEWKENQSLCRVRRFRRKGEDLIGRLRRKPGGQWYFDYAQGWSDDELAFYLSDERFAQGEYISIGNGEAMRPYRITLVEKP
ncbi:hypothetical protein [Phyllobacterium endophyticum]|uniref:Uncharacterized protein n=1 Tax=Phyllobacterium endophyticum TaxID=1149773 RepID=A0A2P7ASG1_9HYPH|nr:hypothetical protein [Phyllobacterium endophyticum]MBB3236867.1 hypothetical protein [Phyllobacterium endophyticum]PSH57120.1 hypothetical protein CU100_17845 [Phyllobacterium endophyticum]TYR40400.1 hypothetical protein FY050_17875 [Phyllobacterium endophyticum]